MGMVKQYVFNRALETREKPLQAPLGHRTRFLYSKVLITMRVAECRSLNAFYTFKLSAGLDSDGIHHI